MMLLCMLMYGVRIFICVFFFFKQKTAYEMRISDWSSDVCSSDLHSAPSTCFPEGNVEWTNKESVGCGGSLLVLVDIHIQGVVLFVGRRQRFLLRQDLVGGGRHHRGIRSEEHTSELQSLMRISYAVFCLKKKNIYHAFPSTLATTSHRC